jgi:hypothetical protein
VCYWVLIYRNRAAVRASGSRWQLDLAAVLTGGGILALSVHWLCFRLLGLLLPRDRTAMYLVLFSTLTVGLTAAVPVPSKAGRICRALLISMLFVMATYFTFCIRLTYFREWKYDAEVNQVFPIVSRYSQTLGINEIPSHGLYTRCLNFYSKFFHSHATFRRFDEYPTNRELYVLYYPQDQAFIEHSGLRVVYHGQMSDIVVAVRPGSPVFLPAPSGVEPVRDPLFWTRFHRALEELKRTSTRR